jgi:hypothetical protein
VVFGATEKLDVIAPSGHHHPRSFFENHYSHKRL